MFITPSFKKGLIVEQFQGNYLKQNAPVHDWKDGINFIEVFFPKNKVKLINFAVTLRLTNKWPGNFQCFVKD